MFYIDLIIDSLHTLFDSMALVMVVLSMALSNIPINFTFPFGFERLEVISAFSMSCFLLFVAAFSIMEGIHHFISPEEQEHSQNIFSIGGLGIFINVLGVILFSQHRVASKEQVRARGAREMNLHAVFLNILCDTFVQFSGVLCSWMQFLGFEKMTFIVSFACGLLIIFVASPLLISSSLILLQTVPQDLRVSIDRCIRDISTYEGVLECRNMHWWSHSPGTVVGTLIVRVRSDADEQEILLYVTNLLQKFIKHLTVQVEKDAPIEWILRRHQ